VNAKLQKIDREIERTTTKIAELQLLLPELERQKTDLENTEIIRLVRSVSIAPGELEEFLRAYRAELAQPASPGTANNYSSSTADNYSATKNYDDEEATNGDEN